MPMYLYQHPDTGEVHEVMQGMNDEHVLEIDGIQLKRIFTVPNAAVKTQLDPFSSSDFVDKTANMKGTVGDMLDMSAELSAARAEKTGGVDPEKRKFFNDYHKRVGKKHLADTKSVIETKSATIDFNASYD